MPFDSAEYQTVARKMLAFFGPNGERWCPNGAQDDHGRVCVLNALWLVHWNQPTILPIADTRNLPARKQIERASNELFQMSAWTVNDFKARGKFAVIRRLLNRMHELEIKALVS